MKQVKVGITTKVNKYYHKDKCYEDFLAEEEFKREESIKKDSLYETVMKIYDIRVLPKSFYMQIEGLRHGNRVFKRQNMGRRYREGYGYDLIEESYMYSRDSIAWSLENKAFTNLANALNYGLSIIINNIYVVEMKRDSKRGKEHMQEVSDNLRQSDPAIIDDFESSYKKKEKDENDISFLFD